MPSGLGREAVSGDGCGLCFLFSMQTYLSISKTIGSNNKTPLVAQDSKFAIYLDYLINHHPGGTNVHK